MTDSKRFELYKQIEELNEVLTECYKEKQITSLDEMFIDGLTKNIKSLRKEMNKA